MIGRNLVLMLSAASLVSAAETEKRGGIVGDVTSLVTRQPLAGVVVAVDGTGVKIESDANGRFHLESLPAGSYRLLVTKDGFLPRLATDVVVTVGRDTPVSLKLEDTVASAEQVDVTASYFAKPVELTTGTFSVSYEEVRRAPGALGDVGRVIQTLPGLAARDDQRNDIIARGGSPSENLILVDNLEVPNLSHFGAFGASGGPISMLNAELVSDARFMAGGFPAPYGNRLSSVLEVNLREGNRERFETELDIGIAGAGLVVEGPLGRRGSWIASARHSYFDLLAGAFNLTDVPRFGNYQVKAVYDLDPRNRLWLVSLGGYDQIHEDIPWEELDNPDMMIVDFLSWRAAGGINWQTLLGQGGVSVLSLARSETHYQYDTWDKMLDRRQVEHGRTSEPETTAKYDLTYAVRGLANLRAGIYLKRLASSITLEQPLGIENPYSVDSARVNVLDLHERFATWQAGGYLQVSRRMWDRITATAGGRYDYYAVRRASRLSPRAGLTWHLTPRLDLSATAGRYYQMPPLALLKTAAANGQLEPIRSDHYVAGLAWYPRPDVKLTVEGYHKRSRSYPVSTDMPGLSLADFGEEYDASLLMPMVAEGQGRSSGLELNLQKKLSRVLWGQLSYAYSRTRQRALDGAWRSATYDLPHVLSAVVGYKVSRGFEVSSKFTYSSGRPDTPYLMDESQAQNRRIFDPGLINSVRNPAYHRLDVRADKRFSFKWGSLVLYAEADNVYNRKNVRAYTWNPKTEKREPRSQLPFMVLGGINLEL